MIILPFSAGILTVVLRYIGSSVFSVTVTLNISHLNKDCKRKNPLISYIFHGSELKIELLVELTQKVHTFFVFARRNIFFMGIFL